jgi:hypothetical protein
VVGKGGGTESHVRMNCDSTHANIGGIFQLLMIMRRQRTGEGEREREGGGKTMFSSSWISCMMAWLSA